MNRWRLLVVKTLSFSQGCAFVDLGALPLVHGGEVSGSDSRPDQRPADGVQSQLQGGAVRRGAGAGKPEQLCEQTSYSFVFTSPIGCVTVFFFFFSSSGVSCVAAVRHRVSWQQISPQLSSNMNQIHQSAHLRSSLLPLTLLGRGSKLQFSGLPAEVPVTFRVVELPRRHHICKVKSLNKGDANSEVTVYYQVENTDSFRLMMSGERSRVPFVTDPTSVSSSLSSSLVSRP